MAVASLVSLSLLAGGCFPNNKRHQTIAKITEGGVALAGIGLLFAVNTGADCMTMTSGTVDQDCEDRASLLGNIGLGLLITGLVGFIVTVSTSEDDKVTTTSTTTTTPPAPVPAAAPASAPLPPAPAEPTPPADSATPAEPAPPPAQ